MALDSFWKAVCGAKEAVGPGAETPKIVVSPVEAVIESRMFVNQGHNRVVNWLIEELLHDANTKRMGGYELQC